MKTLILATAVALAFSTSAIAATKKPAGATATETGKAFITVNGVAVPEIEARIAISDRQAAGVANSPQLQNAIRTQFAVRELSAQQARKLGLDKNAVLQARMRMAREELLARAYQEDYLSKHQPGDDEISKEYEQIKTRSGDKEFHLRHIVAASQDDAKSLITKLKAGEKFADLVAQSRDEVSRARGGDLGWLTPAAILPQFAEAIGKLAKGRYVETPVQGPAGWHVLLLEDTRPFTMPALDDKVKGELRRAIARRNLDTHLGELAKAAKIE